MGFSPLSSVRSIITPQVATESRRAGVSDGGTPAATPEAIPVDSAQVGSAQIVSMPAAVSPAGVAVAAGVGSMSGPAGAMLADTSVRGLLESLAQSGVEFTRPPDWLHWRPSSIAPPDVEKRLQKRGEVLAIVPGEAAPVSLHSADDVHRVAALTGPRETSPLPDAPLANLLNQVHASGCTLRQGPKADSASLTPLAAYDALHASAGLWIWRDDVPLLPIGAAAPSETEKTWTESLAAYAALKADSDAGKGESRANLEVLARPAGNASLAERCAVLDRLAATTSATQARDDYAVVCGTVREGDNLSSVAETFTTFREGTVADRRGAFRYAREMFPDDPKMTRELTARGNWSVFLGARYADVAHEPFGDTSYQERLGTLLEIAALHRKASAWSGDWAHGDLAVDQYRQALACARPGESFASVTGDYLVALRAMTGRGKGTESALASFHVLRQEALDRERFAKVLQAVGDVEQTRQVLQHFDALPPTPDREARVSLGVDLAARTGRLSDAVELYDVVDRAGQDGRFNEAADLMRGLLKDVTTCWATVARPAFEYAWNELSPDPQSLQGFRDVITGVASLETATTLYPEIHKPWDTEGETDRVHAFLTLSAKMRQPYEAGAVFKNLRDSGPCAQPVILAEQYLRGYKLVDDSAGQFDPVGIASEIMGNVVKERKTWPLALDTFLEAVGAMQNGPTALAGTRVVAHADDPVAAESALRALVTAHHGQHCGEAVADLELVLSSRIGGETLQAATARLGHLVGSSVRGEEARTAYQQVTKWHAEGHDPAEVARFERLFDAVGETQPTRQALALVGKPTADSSEAREETLVALARAEGTAGRARMESVADLELMDACRLPGDTQAQASERLQRFIAACRDSKTAREAFRFIMEGCASKRLDPLNADTAAQQMLAAFATDPSLEKAQNWVVMVAGTLAPPKPAGTVSTEDDTVVIGGIRVQRKRSVD